MLFRSKGNDMTDAIALTAIKRIFTYLPTAYQEATNQKAKEQMILAAFEAGVCINNASVTIVHGMSRPIGALFHVPHGISNAMLITTCLEYIADGCYERFATLAKAIGVAEEKTPITIAAHMFFNALEQLCKTCHIPTLKEYGIDRDAYQKAIPKMAHDAVASGSPSNTIKLVTEEEIKMIYEKLYE